MASTTLPVSAVCKNCASSRTSNLLKTGMAAKKLHVAGALLQQVSRAYANTTHHVYLWRNYLLNLSTPARIITASRLPLPEINCSYALEEDIVPVEQFAQAFTMTADAPTIFPGRDGMAQPHQPSAFAHCNAPVMREPPFCIATNTAQALPGTSASANIQPQSKTSGG